MKGFIPKFYRDGQPDGYIMLPCAAGAYQIGQALAIAAGKLRAAIPSDSIKYISMYEGTVGDGVVIPVIAVDCSTEYEVELAEELTDIAPGMEYDIDSDSMSIMTAVSTDGPNVKVISCTGTGVGDTAVVQFI